MLSEKGLKEFMEIFKTDFQSDIDETSAMELGISLLTLFKNSHKPIKKEWLEEYKKQNPNEKYENT